jgi:hypothetical protein
MNKKIDIYTTNSLPLASYLSSVDNVEFIGVNKQDTKTIAFQFKPKETAQELADTYFAGKGEVNPLELFKNYRALKDLIFEARRNVQYQREESENDG